jgi:putative tributyrin esterase
VAIAHVNYFSKSLVKEVGFYALLPDRQEKRGPYPVFYLLHGLSDDYTAWLRWTSIERYVRELPLIVVLPDGDRSFYCDAADGPQYEKAIVEDLIGFVDRYFGTIPRREGRAIGGLSMGGYGAMKLGLKYPRMFCSITGHSGAYGVFRAKNWRQGEGPWKGIVTTNKARRENDCFALASRLKGRKTPAIRFDCGLEDFLLEEHNRPFAAHLRRLGIPHEYEEFPGGHNWAYWDEHIQEAIRFHCRALGIRAGG